MIQNTFEELRLSGNLPSPSGVGMEILRITQRDDHSTEEIGATIMTDAALTGRILKLANSARSASIQPITTVGEATMRLGLRTVRNVALGLSLLSENRSGNCEEFGYDEYWSRSLARAVAAQALSRHTGVGVPAESYILGLLGEIGKLALASVYPEEYAEVLRATDEQSVTALQRAETARFAINHVEVCGLMLEEWGLPDAFQDAVQTFETEREPEPARLPENCADLLRHAHILACACLAGEETSPAEWRRVAAGLRALRAGFALDDGGLRALGQTILAEWREWGATLGVPTDSGVDFVELERRAVTLGARPSSAAELGEIDCCVPPVACEPAPSVPRRTTAARAPRDKQGLRILVIDDDSMSSRLLDRMLTVKGHDVTVASDGRQGLRVALDTMPNMVIADWSMPEMDGVELCRALRRIEGGRRMYFLLVTGKEEEDRVVEAFDAGVDDYVVKPFNPKVLMARITGGQRVIRLQDQVERDTDTMRRQVAELGRLTRKLRTSALTDALTELPNRRYAMKRLDQEWAASVRAHRPLSLVLLDIDNFKSVNDRHGHDVGDIVLREVARVLRDRTRGGEDVCRIGGEEFCVICEGTGAEGALVCAERLRATVEETRITVGDFDRNVTLSLGVAERTVEMCDVNALLKAADLAVYRAKDGGRNRVCGVADDALRSRTA